MTTLLALPPPEQVLAVPTPDDELVSLWLYGRGPHTTRAYSADIRAFRAMIPKPLERVTLADLQRYADSLGGAVESKRRHLSIVKSLFGFAARTGYLNFNVSAALRVPKGKGLTADRILSEPDVLRCIALAEGRDRVLIVVLYAGGVRVAEAVSLRWKDCQVNGDSGQITVTGKGDKTRAVPLGRTAWDELQSLRKGAPDDAYVFVGRKGHLSELQARKIVWRVTLKALGRRRPPHCFRHSHVSHALRRGAPMAVVRDTVGHASLATLSRYAHAMPTESSSHYLAF